MKPLKLLNGVLLLLVLLCAFGCPHHRRGPWGGGPGGPDRPGYEQDGRQGEMPGQPPDSRGGYRPGPGGPGGPPPR